MNVHHSLILELIHYEFEKDYNVTRATKNFSCAEGDGSIDNSKATRCFFWFARTVTIKQGQVGLLLWFPKSC